MYSACFGNGAVVAEEKLNSASLPDGLAKGSALVSVSFDGTPASLLSS
jgi:hypothetical protein